MIQKTLYGESCLILDKETRPALEKNYTGYIVLNDIKTIIHIMNDIAYHNLKGWACCNSDYIMWKSNDLADFSITGYQTLSVVILDQIEGFEYMRYDSLQYKTLLEFSETLPNADMSDPEQVKTHMDFFLAKRIKLYKCLDKDQIVLYPAYPGVLEVLENKVNLEEIFQSLEK